MEEVKKIQKIGKVVKIVTLILGILTIVGCGVGFFGALILAVVPGNWLQISVELNGSVGISSSLSVFERLVQSIAEDLPGGVVTGEGNSLLVEFGSGEMKNIPLTKLLALAAFVGALTAAACLPEGRLDAVAEGLKKVVTWILTTALLLFTVYLSVVRIVSGSADGATVKVAKAAISGVVPVVGGILSEVSETVMAGAGMLKNTIGIFGMLAVLAACAYPFLQLGVQYLLYKLSAFLAAAVGPPGLSKLIGGLGGAFGLVLGMTGAAALLLLVSILASVGAVMP